MAVFQPAEETAEGAQAMIDDGLFDRFPKPDVVLGQHVMVGPAAIGGRAGAITSAADSLQIRLFGRGAHGSMPQASIDPVVMAAATVMRLQTIVSRELAAAEAAVVTIGSLQAGTKENVIPEEAVIKLNVRSFDEGCASACSPRSNGSSTPRPLPRAPPGRRRSRRSTAIPLWSTIPRRASASPTRSAGTFPPTACARPDRRRPSEDFGSFGAEWHAPSVFWFVGGTDPDRYTKATQAGRLNEIPTNHNPRFAPVIHPTLQTGVEALIVAARAWLAP
jgi:metal-dependent amidase/aminoacylase/carboxypeptidase family protein